MISLREFFLGLSVIAAVVVVIHNHFFAFPRAMARAEKGIEEAAVRRIKATNTYLLEK